MNENPANYVNPDDFDSLHIIFLDRFKALWYRIKY